MESGVINMDMVLLMHTIPVKEVNDSIVSADVLSNSVYPAKGCFVKINNLCDYNQTCTEIDINSYVCTEIDGLFSINDSYLFINSLPSSP